MIFNSYVSLPQGIHHQWSGVWGKFHSNPLSFHGKIHAFPGRPLPAPPAPLWWCQAPRRWRHLWGGRRWRGLRCGDAWGIHGIPWPPWNLYGYGSIPFLVGWTSVYQLFWCELQGYKVLTHCHMENLWKICGKSTDHLWKSLEHSSNYSWFIMILSMWWLSRENSEFTRECPPWFQQFTKFWRWILEKLLRVGNDHKHI